MANIKDDSLSLLDYSGTEKTLQAFEQKNIISDLNISLNGKELEAEYSINREDLMHHPE